jgi:hypothetical protein
MMVLIGLTTNRRNPMKRIRLTLSILVASVLGCVALNGTAAAAPQYLGVSSCTMHYDYCLAIGQPQAYCWAQLEQCCEAIGGCTNGVAAGKAPTGE